MWCRMKLLLNVQRTTHGFEITCCNSKDIKVTKQKSGRCWFEMHLKCKKCGTRAFFKHWHYDGYTPTKEEKELGSKREVQRNQYTFEIKK